MQATYRFSSASFFLLLIFTLQHVKAICADNGWFARMARLRPRLFVSTKGSNDFMNDLVNRKLHETIKSGVDGRIQALKNDVEKARKRAALTMSVVGLADSITTSILTDKAQFHRWKPGVEALTTYLKSSGLEEELNLDLKPSLEVTDRLVENIKIIGRLQQDAQHGKDRRDEFLSTTVSNDNLPSWEEAERYMKYASACYGDAMIMGAKLDVSGQIDLRPGYKTNQRISEHIGVPEKDLVLVDVTYAGLANYLRHFIAVDHTNRKVVLAIRGTFSLSEVLTDVSGYTRPFCGGEAHSEMSKMAENLWERVGSTVLEELRKHPDYELILTGHSLGAGSANLLNILLHENDSRRIEGRPVRCFAYASPPVFTPLDAVPEAVNSAVNYIHEMDDVPFLCGDTVRRLFTAVCVLEETTKGMDSKARTKLLEEGTSDTFISECVLQATLDPLPDVEGVPPLAVPTKVSVWMCDKRSGKYDAKLCDPLLLLKAAIYLDPDRTADHLPARYEDAFSSLEA